jgi:hypothetical protein
MAELGITVAELTAKLQSLADDPALRDISVVFRVPDSVYDSQTEQYEDKDFHEIKGVEIRMHNETWTPVQVILEL